MTPEHYQKVMLVLDSVIECDPDRREFTLNEACSQDDQLRGDVEKLLARYEQAAGFMEESPIEVIAGLRDDEAARSVVGTRVGPYRITGEIGRGGMGAVYLGVRDDEHFQRQVAIKLIKRGMDTDFILRRFRNERQILANLNHPNIARLYNGGTTEDGLPFFVMEFVEGVPIDEYCVAHQLPLAGRLRLFRSVCAAVHYAHQSLVVHRDLKPSNILVTTDGTPKLLDFGIAKLLHPDLNEQRTEMTATELRLMTPEYASPEQVRGLPVTTATDVYSLGVILYELLTGCRPYRIKSRRPDEVARLICEQEPAKPSQSIVAWRLSALASPEVVKPEIQNSRLLRGDIDNIVLMAMRKDASRRYASVDQLSEDIRRHLEHRPVHARKDTITYRGGSFIKRNKIAVTGAALIFLTLLVGIVATAWQSHVAHAQQARAERRFNDVRKLANIFLFELNDEIEKGPTKARELLVRHALEYLDSLAQESEDDLSLQRELATAYQKVGDVQSRLHGANLGNSQGALKSYQKSLALREAIAAADPKNPETNLDLAVSYNRTGDILSKTGNTPAALEGYQKGLAVFERIQRVAPPNVQMLREMSGNYLSMGRALMKTGDSSETLKAFRNSQDIRETLAGQYPQDATLQRDLIASYESVAFVLMESGKTSEALDLNRKSLKISEALIAASPGSVPLRRSLHQSHFSLGVALRDAGAIAGALDHHQTALAIAQELLNADPTNTQAQNDLADVYMETANTLTTAHQTAAAMGLYRKAIKEYEGVSAADTNNVHVRRQIYYTYTFMGDAQAQAGETAAALETFRQTLAAFQDLTARDPANTEFRHDLAISYRKLGEMLLKTGDSGAALENLRQALPLAESLSAQSLMNATKRRDLALTYSALGITYVKLAAHQRPSVEQRSGYLHEARTSFQKSLAVWLEMQAKGTLIVAHSRKPDEVARELARLEHLQFQ